MTALNVEFTDVEMDRLRAEAGRRGMALKPYAHNAIMAAVDDHNERVLEAFQFVAERSVELNRRLA